MMIPNPAPSSPAALRLSGPILGPAAHGLRRWEGLLDPSALVITMLEKLGLARNVVRITPERQHEREREAGPVRAAARIS